MLYRPSFRGCGPRIHAAAIRTSIAIAIMIEWIAQFTNQHLTIDFGPRLRARSSDNI